MELLVKKYLQFTLISIKDDENIKYGSTDFAHCTISEYAFEQIHKACASLACTALDLIEREDLLQEIKQEFYNKK